MKFSAILSFGATFVAASAAIHKSPRTQDEFPVLSLENITKMEVETEGGQQRRGLWGPWLGVDFPDPSIIYGDGSWKAYGTSSNGKNVPIAVSSDAITWSLTGDDALPNVGSWVDPSDHAIWAPDMQKNVSLHNAYVLFTIRST